MKHEAANQVLGTFAPNDNSLAGTVHVWDGSRWVRYEWDGSRWVHAPRSGELPGDEKPQPPPFTPPPELPG
jgi:hypothetical protein